jgi:hypothetical protein
MRYELLFEQFQIKSYDLFYQDLQQSLDRLFSYVYNYTDIMYIEFIDKDTLYDYIKYHRSKKEREIHFIEIISDVKKFLFYLEGIKKIRHVPKIDLSVKNFNLWTKL